MRVTCKEDLSRVIDLFNEVVEFSFTFGGAEIVCKLGSYRLHVVSGGDDDLLPTLLEVIGISKPAAYIHRHFYPIEAHDTNREDEGGRLHGFPEGLRGLHNYERETRSMLEWLYSKYDSYRDAFREATAPIIKAPRISTTRAPRADGSLLLPSLKVQTIPNISITIL